jgi:hypothetical protein
MNSIRPWVWKRPTAGTIDQYVTDDVATITTKLELYCARNKCVRIWFVDLMQCLQVLAPVSWHLHLSISIEMMFYSGP